MYGYAGETSVNSIRVKMLQKMVGLDKKLHISSSKVDLSRLPPCKDALVPHINRANHRVACFKNANIPIYNKPKPNDPSQGWIRNEAGVLEPRWTLGPILPESLVDLIEEVEKEDELAEDDLELEVESDDDDKDEDEDVDE